MRNNAIKGNLIINSAINQMQTTQSKSNFSSTPDILYLPVVLWTSCLRSLKKSLIYFGTSNGESLCSSCWCDFMGITSDIVRRNSLVAKSLIYWV